MLTVEQINKIADPVERRKLKIQIIQRSKAKKVRTDFLSFVKHIPPGILNLNLLPSFFLHG
jgi:hypothetical protein